MSDLPGIAAIKALLEAMATVEKPERGRGGFLLEHGRQWLGVALDRGMRQGTPKACFANSQRLVMRRPELKLRYCEGYALSSSIGVQVPIHHGWAVDDEGRVVDITFPEPEGSVYFGVPFTLDYLETRSSLGRPDSFLDGDDFGYDLLHDRSAARAAVEEGWGPSARRNAAEAVSPRM